MSFLLDTNICSAHLNRPSGLAHRFIQHGGGLFISTVVLGELFAGAQHSTNPLRLIAWGSGKGVREAEKVSGTFLRKRKRCQVPFWLTQVPF